MIMIFSILGTRCCLFYDKEESKAITLVCLIHFVLLIPSFYMLKYPTAFQQSRFGLTPISPISKDLCSLSTVHIVGSFLFWCTSFNYPILFYLGIRVYSCDCYQRCYRTCDLVKNEFQKRDTKILSF